MLPFQLDLVTRTLRDPSVGTILVIHCQQYTGEVVKAAAFDAVQPKPEILGHKVRDIPVGIRAIRPMINDISLVSVVRQSKSLYLVAVDPLQTVFSSLCSIRKTQLISTNQLFSPKIRCPIAMKFGGTHLNPHCLASDPGANGRVPLFD